MEDISRAVLRQAARKNFWLFCVYYDYEFFYIKRPFLYVVALAFQDIFDRKIITLSVSMPPRAGKSYITSLFCAWVLGREPEQSIMRNSVTSTLFRKFSYDVREVLKSMKFKEVFPDVELSGDKQSIDGWNTTKAVQVSYFGNGVGGTIIGFGASRIALTDDLYRGHEDALSETINESTHQWYNSAHKSRVEKGCAMIDIGTRWSLKDVIGKNSEAKYYDRELIIPAIIDGVSFCEDVKTTAEYIKLRSETNSIIWESEYMQNPIEMEGVFMPFNKIKRYTDVTGEGVNLIYIDPADEGTDHFAALIGRLIGNNFYVTDAVFNLENLTTNEEVIKEKLLVHKIDQCFIEANNFGAYFIRNIRKESPHVPVTAIKNTTNKLGRILAQSGFILEFFLFPEKPNEQLTKFMRQMSSVSADSKSNDDAADATAGIAAAIRRNYYK